jgi:hypothetical protein
MRLHADIDRLTERVATTYLQPISARGEMEAKPLSHSHGLARDSGSPLQDRHVAGAKYMFAACTRWPTGIDNSADKRSCGGRLSASYYAQARAAHGGHTA